MIKILIISGTMSVGGIENQLMHLARKADKKKFQIDFTTTEHNPYYREEIEYLGGKCLYIKGTNGFHFFRYCKQLYKVLKTNNYDIVHSHELFHSGMVLFVARLAGVKARFVHAHNWTDMSSLTEKRPFVRTVYNAIMRKLIQHNATDFCACSSYAGKFLYGEKIMSSSHYHLIYNSVDIDKYLDSVDERTDNLEFMEDDWINILHVGRMCLQKDQLFLVDIAKEFKKRDKKIRILCAGDYSNDYGELVQQKITHEQVQDYIKLIGIRSDIDALLKRCSVFVLPSQFEGMPLVLIEAQASGIPCISANTFSHEVDFGLNLIQWIKKEELPEVWADAIESAVHKERARQEDIISAVKKYGFDSQSFTDKICNLYEKAINES